MSSAKRFIGGLSGLVRWISRRWRRSRLYLKLVAPCWLAILVTAAISAAMLHPQTVDALAALAEERGILSRQHFAVLLTLVLFATSAWYITRALLYVDYPDGPEDSGQMRFRLQVITWLPRCLGVLPILAVSSAFLRSRNFLFFVIYIALAFVFLVLLHLRRKWLNARASAKKSREGAVLGEATTSLPTTTRIIVTGTVITAFLCLGLVIASPVIVPTAVGPLGIVFIAGSGWVIAGSVLLIYMARRFRLPSLFATMIVLGIIFAAWNDNHGIAPIEESSQRVGQRPILETQFEAWVEHRLSESDVPESDSPYPVFVVTAEGGGIRAAYWTAAILNSIASKAPDFPCHVFGISGVSGGSLGAAAFAARQADVYHLADDRGRICTESNALQLASKLAGSEVIETTHADWIQDVRDLRVELRALGKDFLSPVLAGMLFPDFVQRLLPFPIMPDRGSYLERSWESAWPRAWNEEASDDNSVAVEFTDRRRDETDNRFERDFLRLWNEELALLTPSLFLNATRVETGERVIVSNLSLEDERGQADAANSPFGFAIDLLDRMGGSVALSQAVHFSARFTYVSPAATVLDRTNGESTKIVDGGYFENSGAETANDVIDVLQRACDDLDHRCQVHAIIISNAVDNPNAWQADELVACNCTAGEPECDSRGRRAGPEPGPARPTSSFLPETLTPLRALFATRSARGYLAEEQLYSAMPCFTYRAQLKNIGKRDIPLGWILSDNLRTDMEAQASSSQTALYVAEIVSNYWDRRSGDRVAAVTSSARPE